MYSNFKNKNKNIFTNNNPDRSVLYFHIKKLPIAVGVAFVNM